MIKLWHRFFLIERPSISLTLFRMAVALTTGCVMIPTFFHMGDNYFSTAFKTHNGSFFTPEFVQWVSGSPEWVIVAMAVVFCCACAGMLVGFLSKASCIIMTACCYYFYALNAFAMGTLSWDILLVTLFLMCMTPYQGDYFSVDCLIWGREDAYKRKRPFYIQRLLQLQIGFTFFYTALYKVTAKGNWFADNPLLALMNYPSAGVTKSFLLKDVLMNHPQVCYWLGVLIVVVEFLMIFLLFIHRTRVAAIYLGITFHIVLILTLDVPATFFLLFPPQLLLFINPDRIVHWIDQKRMVRKSGKQNRLIYDGQCQFCIASVNRLKIMDLFGSLEYVDFQQFPELSAIHPDLTKAQAMSQLHLVETDGKLYGGFDVFRRICFTVPMLYPTMFIFYLPGMRCLGQLVYKLIARNRYLFHFGKVCKDNACFRKT